MPRAINEKLIYKRHKEMLKYQKAIKPFTPTIRELAAVWGVTSSNTVYNCLLQMQERDLLATREKGFATEYYAVKRVV